MKIGELAKQTHINASTIRYYEKLGLLPKAQRTSAGYRVYDSQDIQAINLIKLAQSLGFSLDEVALITPQQAKADHQNILSKLDEKKREIDQLITTLENRKQQIDMLYHELEQTWRNGQCYQAKAELIQMTDN